MFIQQHRTDSSYMGTRSRSTSQNEPAEERAEPSTSRSNTDESPFVERSNAPRPTSSFACSDCSIFSCGRHTTTSPRPRRHMGSNRIMDSADILANAGHVNAAVQDIEDLEIFPSSQQNNARAASENHGNSSETMLEQPDEAVLTSCSVKITQPDNGSHVEEVYRDMIVIQDPRSRPDPQILKHVVLVILLLMAALSDLLLCCWELLQDKSNGSLLELELFHFVLLCGQGVFVFGIFGLLEPSLYQSVAGWFRHYFSTSSLTLPLQNELSPETKAECEKFVHHHLNNCKTDISRCIWQGMRRHREVFTGCDLVDWFIDASLARDRAEAVILGRRLLDGRIIAHVNQKQHFHDLTVLYQFCSSEEQSSA